MCAKLLLLLLRGVSVIICVLQSCEFKAHRSQDTLVLVCKNVDGQADTHLGMSTGV